MSLDTYANLKVAVREWTRRNDIDAHIDDVIDICEAEIYHGVDPLRLRSMETRSTADMDGTRYLALPTGFLQMRQLRATAKNEDIRFRAPEQMAVHTTSGKPRFFTITSQLELDRVPDDTYEVEMSYYKIPTPLSSANTSNDVLANHPNIYLYGCRWAAYDYASEPEMANYNYGKFVNAIKGANRSDKKGRYGTAPVMRIEGCTP